MNKMCLVIDMINDFRNGKLSNPRMERIIPNIVNLLERKTKDEMKRFFACDRHRKGDRELKIFTEHGMEGTTGSLVINELQKFLERDGSNYVPKNSYSVLFDTDLIDIILEEKPEEIYLVGVCTDICVLHAAIALFYLQEELDFKVKIKVIRDCVETYDLPGHNADTINEVVLNHIKDVLGFEIVETQAQI